MIFVHVVVQMPGDSIVLVSGDSDFSPNLVNCVIIFEVQHFHYKAEFSQRGHAVYLIYNQHAGPTFKANPLV